MPVSITCPCHRLYLLMMCQSVCGSMYMYTHVYTHAINCEVAWTVGSTSCILSTVLYLLCFHVSFVSFQSYIKCKHIDYMSSRTEPFYDIQINIKGKKDSKLAFCVLYLNLYNTYIYIIHILYTDRIIIDAS